MTNLEAQKADEKAEAAEKAKQEEHRKYLADNALEKRKECDRIAQLDAQEILMKQEATAKIMADLEKRDLAKAEKQRATEEADAKMKREREDDEKEVQEVKKRRLDKERQVEQEAAEAAEAAAFLSKKAGA